jgi:chemotaxis regulatin CheY-phosphate phosphatase CheZ
MPEELAEVTQEEDTAEIEEVVEDIEMPEEFEEVVQEEDTAEIEDVAEEIEMPEELEEVTQEEETAEIEDVVEEIEIPEELEEVTQEEEAAEIEDVAEEIEMPEELEEVTQEEEAAEIEDVVEEIEIPEELEEVVQEEDTAEIEDVVEEIEMPEEPAEEEAVEEDEDPMSAMKDAIAETAGNEQEPFDKLKTLSKKIIDGETVDIGLDIKGEVSELLKLIMETKDRVDEIEPTLATSNKHLPSMLNHLESVTEYTEDATLTLMESADGLNNYYQEFIEEIEDLEDLIYKKDPAAIIKKIDKLQNDTEEADRMGYNILHALEFQDITEQKLNKVMNSITDIGSRLGAILGFIKVKHEQDPATVDDASQDDIDKLLADFGLD